MKAYYPADEVDRQLAALQEELRGLHKRAAALARANNSLSDELVDAKLQVRALTAENERLLDKVMTIWEQKKALETVPQRGPNDL